MTHKPSQARYSGGGKVKYLVYRSPQPLRSGRKRERTRVKRMYFPANAREIVLEHPGTFRRRTGSTVYGVALHYRSRLPATRARRGGRTYRPPERWTQRTKIVDLPSGAVRVRLTSRAPEGPRMAVR